MALYPFEYNRIAPLAASIEYAVRRTPEAAGFEQRAALQPDAQHGYTLVHRRRLADIRAIVEYVESLHGPRDGFELVDPLDGVTRRFRIADDSGVQGRLWPAGGYGELDVPIISVPDEDLTPPVVLSVTPANGGASGGLLAPVVWTFDSVVHTDDVSDTYFHVLDSTTGGAVPGVLSLNEDGDTVTFTPDTPYTAGRLYLPQVEAGVRDLSTNRLAAAYGSRFTATES